MRSLNLLQRTAHQLQRRSAARPYHFASADYDSCFGNLPTIDGSDLRKATVARLKQHEADPSKWYEDPVVTVVNGNQLRGGTTSATTDAFNKENGKIRLATQAELDIIKTHLHQFNVTDETDFRTQVRAMEAEIFELDNAAELVALQAAEFYKQDGVTEIEESIEANEVERRLNDRLLQDEKQGVIDICRAPVFVGCVSNFSNFLDLSRKVLRHLEVGVPCVVLSRSNTTQHMYRWYQKLDSMMERHGLNRGMLTYAAISVDQTQQLFSEFPNGPMHITTSRQVAESVRNDHKNVLSSTGGPNTLVATELTPDVAQAIRWSAAIENSGQCKHVFLLFCFSFFLFFFIFFFKIFSILTRTHVFFFFYVNLVHLLSLSLLILFHNLHQPPTNHQPTTNQPPTNHRYCSSPCCCCRCYRGGHSLFIKRW